MSVFHINLQTTNILGKMIRTCRETNNFITLKKTMSKNRNCILSLSTTCLFY